MLQVLSHTKKSAYRHNYERIRAIFLNFTRHPISMIRFIVFLTKAKFSKFTTFKHFSKINRGAYSVDLSFRDRVNIFIFNFDFVIAKFGVAFLDRSKYKLKLWSLLNNDDIAIYLSAAVEKWNHEGESSLDFYYRDKSIFTFSFVICDGSTFGYKEPIILLTKIQGVRAHIFNFNLINKSIEHLKISNALLSSLEGLSISLGINQIVSVNSSSQLSRYGIKLIAAYQSTYDEFLCKNGGLLTHRDSYYSIPIPLIVRPITEVHSHRSRKRYLKHHALRMDISEATKKSMQHLSNDPLPKK